MPDHSCRIVIIGGSGSRKANALLDLVKEQDSDELIDKIYLYPKDVNKPKYQFLIEKRENAGIKYLNDPKAFMEYSQYMDDIYNNIDDYIPNKKRKILIVFDDMIADIMAKKKFQAIIKECRKLNIFLVFIPQFYFSVPKEVTRFIIKEGSKILLLTI